MMTPLVPTKFSAQKKKADRFLHWWVYAPTAAFMAVAALMYSYRDYVTQIIHSDDFCENDRIIEISTWVFPKIIEHCDLITNSALRNHPSAGIAIPIDVFVGTFCLLILLIVFNHLMRLNRGDLNYIRYKMINFKFRGTKFSGGLNLGIWWPFLFFAAYLGYSCYVDVFVSSPLAVQEKETSGLFFNIFRHNATFASEYGLGPMVQIAIASVGNMFFYVAVIESLVLILLPNDPSIPGDFD